MSNPEGLEAKRKLQQIEDALETWMHDDSRTSAGSLALTLLIALRDDSRMEKAQKLLHPERKP
jgi:hypothetical protein